VSGTGEFERIDLFLQAFRDAGGRTSSPSVMLGPGDDAAIFQSRLPISVTTDALFEDVHFRRGWGTWEQVGWKSLAVNLSDLAAMGARPLAFTCAIGHPTEFEESVLIEVAQGMGRLASQHGATLIGGNFSRAKELSLTITAFGEQTSGVLRRDTAKPGDVVLLVGDIGVAAAELRWLLVDRKLPAGRSALLEPTPLITAGLVAADRAACAVDVSDGLAQDLGHVAKASQVRIELDFQRLPASARFDELTNGLPESTRAELLLAGGEDYALAIAAPATIAVALCRDLPAVEIGHIVEGQGVEIANLPTGTRLIGHDHFRAK
jgi:thiamine-monophosphate kinase